MKIELINCGIVFHAPFDIEKYTESKETLESDEYTKVLTDSEGRILYAEYTYGDVLDNSSDVGNATFTDGVIVVDAINKFKTM